MFIVDLTGFYSDPTYLAAVSGNSRLRVTTFVLSGQSLLFSSVMHTGNNARRFSSIVLLLQILAAWNPLSAAETATDSDYYRLIVATCYTCHSAAGHEDGAIPQLQGLTGARIRELLNAYKSDAEQVTIMNRISKALTDAEIDRISAILGGEEH